MKHTLLALLLLTLACTAQAGRRNPKREKNRKGKKPPKALYQAKKQQPQEPLDKQIEAVESTLNPLIKYGPVVGCGVGAAVDGAFYYFCRMQNPEQPDSQKPVTPIATAIGSIVGAFFQTFNSDHTATHTWQRFKQERKQLEPQTKEFDDHQAAMAYFLNKYPRLFPNTERLQERLRVKTKPADRRIVEEVFECPQQ